MDMIESWAIHGNDFPMSALYGAEGGLQFCPDDDKGHLNFYSEIEGYPASTSLDVGKEQYRRLQSRPELYVYENSQAHWVGVLRDECEQIDTPHIALQTMLISEGIFLSGKLEREVTADEIPELCKSTAISQQDTPFGGLTYPPHPFMQGSIERRKK